MKPVYIFFAVERKRVLSEATCLVSITSDLDEAICNARRHTIPNTNFSAFLISDVLDVYNYIGPLLFPDNLFTSKSLILKHSTFSYLYDLISNDPNNIKIYVP